MKPLERIFFQACVMKKADWSIRDIVNTFAVLGFPCKQLWRYLEKWCRKGFYDYGVTLDLGWLYPNEFTGEYKVMYEEIIKKRVKICQGEKNGLRKILDSKRPVES